jgi:hypothetical protein
MKRLLVLALLLGSLVLPSTVLGFHHGGLPSTACAAEAAGSPSNDNGMAKESLIAHNPAQTLPLPPVGTPGQFAPEGAEFCANGD